MTELEPLARGLKLLDLCCEKDCLDSLFDPFEAQDCQTYVPNLRIGAFNRFFNVFEPLLMSAVNFVQTVFHRDQASPKLIGQNIVILDVIEEITFKTVGDESSSSNYLANFSPLLFLAIDQTNKLSSIKKFLKFLACKPLM